MKSIVIFCAGIAGLAAARMFLILLVLVIAITIVSSAVTSRANVSSAITSRADKSPEIVRTVTYDVRGELRVWFAAEHGVANPSALVAAVEQSDIAELLICVAIEESLGDPVAVGLAGEEGAWQVIASHWGSVPEDIHGQATQAEKIIRGLLRSAKGDKKEALARYNGGDIPAGVSYRYAERILKREALLRVAAN